MANIDYKDQNFILAVASIVLGLLFVIFKSGVIGIAMTVLGIACIVSAVFDFINNNTTPAIIKLAIGIVIIVLGWAVAVVASIILAVLLIAYGGKDLYEFIKSENKPLVQIIKPALMLLIGIAIIIGQFGALDILFIIAGIIFIVNGGFMLAEIVMK